MNELYCLNKTTRDISASISTWYSFLRCNYIVLLHYSHTHKRTMITFLRRLRTITLRLKEYWLREINLADLLNDSCLIIYSALKCTLPYVFYLDLMKQGIFLFSKWKMYLRRCVYTNWIRALASYEKLFTHTVAVIKLHFLINPLFIFTTGVAIPCCHGKSNSFIHTLKIIRSCNCWANITQNF